MVGKFFIAVLQHAFLAMLFFLFSLLILLRPVALSADSKQAFAPGTCYDDRERDRFSSETVFLTTWLPKSSWEKKAPFFIFFA